MATVHHVQTHHLEGLAFESIVNNHIIQLDTTPAGGGQDSGPSPKPLLLSALAGCTGIDVAGMLNKMRVPFSNFTLDVSADLSDEHPRVYTHIHLKYLIHVAEEDRDKVEKAVTLSEEKYCGVSAMLKKVCPLTWEIIYR